MARGDWQPLSSMWPNLRAACALGGRVYAAEGETLYLVEPNGDYVGIGDDEWRPGFLMGVAGALIAIEPNGGMYRIDPADGSFAELAGTWSAVIAACGGGDHIFVIEQSGTLYRVSPADGSYTALAAGFAGTRHLAAAGGTLITIEQGGAMYRVSPKDGSSDPLEEGWAGTTAVAGDDDRLYCVTGESLYVVDPRDGTYQTLNEDAWRSRALVAVPGQLFAFEPNGGLYAIHL